MPSFRAFLLCAGTALVAIAAAQQPPEGPSGTGPGLAALQPYELLHRRSADGRRAPTRYELAAAAYDLWTFLKSQLPTKRVSARKGEDRLGVDETRAEILRVKELEPELQAISRLLVEYEPELTQLGLDYEVLRRQLGNLEPRVDALAQARLPVRVSGAATWLSLAADSGGGNYGVDQLGRPLGYGRGSQAGQGVNWTRDLTVLHEWALKLEGTENDPSRWEATLVAGNVTGAMRQGEALAGQPYREAPSSFALDSLRIPFETRFLNGEIGRIGHASNPLLLRKPDTTPYLRDPRWDSPEWKFDGLRLNGKRGAFRVHAFGGRAGNLSTAGDLTLQTLRLGRTSLPWTPGSSRPIGLLPGAQAVDSLAGLDVEGEAGAATFAANLLDWSSIESGGGGGGQAIGAVGSGRLASGRLEASYGETRVGGGQPNRNRAFQLAYRLDSRAAGGYAGYRVVEPLFGGAGDWGRIGMWWNPTDIQGWFGGVDLRSQAGRFYAEGQLYRGTALEVAGASGLGKDDQLSSLRLGTEREVGGLKGDASWESVRWRLRDRPGFTGGSPTEQWFSVGIERETGSSLVAFHWLVSAIDSDGVAGFQLGTNTRARGSLWTVQASLRF